MAARSTCKRLSYSFWWSTITRDMKNYVATCERFIRRNRVTEYYRTPIRSMGRSSHAFQHWWCDIAGRLFPNQKVDYLLFCCLRWPMAFASRSVTQRIYVIV